MADPSPQLTLSVGDRVVYPNQGVCRVDSVEAKEVAGQKLTFVTMRREDDGAVVMVPQAKVQSIGIRRVSSADDVAKVYEFLKADGDKATLDWKQRARTNADRMSQGGLLGLAEVVKGLQVLSELRPLPAKERELYDSARHLLVEEIAVALSITECDAEDSIDLVLSPVGRERPKRTAAEFRPGGDDDLDLGDDLMGLGGDLDLPPDGEDAEEDSGPKKAALSDDDETQPMATALTDEDLADLEPPPKRGRGRPPKAKGTVETIAVTTGADSSEIPSAPRKRGRPPKAKPAAEATTAEKAAPKKRGRPPKAAKESAGAGKAEKAKKKK